MVEEVNSINNDRPIIGILCEKILPIQEFLPEKYKNHTSFIAASYVKYVESSGARVVPIFLGRERTYYEDLLSKINGVLFPGGAEWFNEENGYAEAGKHIYEIAMKLNDNKIHFPIFGICLGFELLFHLSDKDQQKNLDCKGHRKPCLNRGRSKNVIFKPDFKSSKLFNCIEDSIYKSFTTSNIANYYHGFCITEDVLENLEMDQSWKVLMTGEDDNELEFINAIESKKYPFYGVQFHPEKSAFEWGKPWISHSTQAIKSNRFFGDFFISECKKNSNKFDCDREELSSLIYNHEIVPTRNKFEQCYVFTSTLPDCSVEN